MPRLTHPCWLVLFCLQQLAFSSDIHLNGQPMSVLFTDGDTFRILDGPYKGTSARLVGFNALESYGPVHEWGQWMPKELYRFSKEATVAARLGNWDCVSNFKKDVYGRILCTCEDLALELLQKGLAHVMIVDKGSSNPSLVEAQKEAIRMKTGMWRKGAPPWIVTSIHSIEESSNSHIYDRLVSTKDGSSEMRTHDEAYEECQKVCYGPFSKRLVHINEKSNPQESCMVYVGFGNRYGKNRADCLKN